MNNIKNARKRAGLSQKQVALELKVSAPTVSEWENGKKQPTAKNLALLSNLLHTSTDYLLNVDQSAQSSSGVWINVLGRVAAGVPLESIEEILDQEEITHEMASKGDFFGLKIKGDSMEPKFSNGDTVIVRKQSDIESGDIAIILINGEDAVCKKVLKNSNGIALVSTNPAYDPLYYSAQEVADLPVVILGKVVELRAKF